MKPKSNVQMCKMKWYLIYDGKEHKVVNNLAEYETLNVIIIEITSQQAAAYLLMKQTYASE